VIGCFSATLLDDILPGVTPEQWSAVREVFDEALEIEAVDRNEWLENRCGTDRAVLEEVQRLLIADDGAADAGTLNTSELPLDASDDLTGRDIGPYKLLDKIGEGGMGSVYRAVRTDAAFDKTVAVKLIGFRNSIPAVENAFRKERRILAGLNHPNIATLYDAGTTPDGQLYLVMELVSGEPIDVYCRKRNFELDARLALFLQVCSAVQFAHTHLVVHRDLKPQNILVTPDGHVKLLDFGIAKMLSGSAGETETLFSGMTLRYASPEQITGQAITTASDVYSLGVVLYELLTAKHPYPPTGHGLHEWARVICEADPARPSTVGGETLVF
jgi:serine/threonine-protein kinase